MKNVAPPLEYIMEFSQKLIYNKKKLRGVRGALVTMTSAYSLIVIWFIKI